MGNGRMRPAPATAAGFLLRIARTALRFRRQRQEQDMPRDDKPTIWDLMPASLWQPFIPSNDLTLASSPEGLTSPSGLPPSTPASSPGASDAPIVSEWD